MPGPSRVALFVAGGVLTLGAAAYGASYVLAGPGVPRGVHVAGADIGGLDRARAGTVLQDTLGRTAGPVLLRAAGDVLRLDPGAAGLALDVDATLDDATSPGPLDRLLGLLGGRRDVAPRSDVDAPRLTGELERLAAGFDRLPVEGAVRFQGLEPVPVLPVAGRSLQVPAAARAVLAGWLLDADLEVPTAVLPVKSTEQGVRDAVERLARPAVAAPVTLDAAGRPLVLEPAEIAAALVVEADDDGKLVPRLDGAKLLAGLGERASLVASPARDARFDLTTGTPVVVPAESGRAVAPEALAAAVTGLLTAPAPRTAALELAVQEPELTTAQAQALGIAEVIGTFTTRHPCCRPRVTNIHTIADLVDGGLVLPGQTYSLNGDVGPRDTARGFLPAPQILDGQFVDAVGGGVSQFATTMYNATFFAGLQDVEHKPHSYYITRYPEGREATVSTPAPDLKWRNDSPYGVLIDTSYTRGSITVTLWGTKRYDEVLSLSSGRSRVKPFGTEYVQRSDCTSARGHVGFDVTTTRVLKRAGAEVARDSSTHRYLPEPRFICGPPPVVSSPTPAASSPAPSSPAPSSPAPSSPAPSSPAPPLGTPTPATTPLPSG